MTTIQERVKVKGWIYVGELRGCSVYMMQEIFRKDGQKTNGILQHVGFIIYGKYWRNNVYFRGSKTTLLEWLEHSIFDVDKSLEWRANVEKCRKKPE